ncbi:MAG: hypothetical protein R3C02_22200 [Planctomycetaceae bacterium]
MSEQFAIALSRAACGWRVSGILLLILLTGLQPTSAFAAGTEYTMRAADLELAVDSRWAGCRDGGYYPIRIQVTNKSLDRVITFEYHTDSVPAVPTVRRSLSLSQNATANVTLSIPCVGAGTYGSLRVLQNGRLIKDLTRNISLPDIGYGTRRPALLVISPASVDATAFEAAVTSSIMGATSSAYGGAYYGSSGEDNQVVEPSLLPESWIDYSGLDLVAIPLNTLSKLESDHRSAILKWVHSGGTLIVYDVGEPATESEELSRVLALDTFSSANSAWTPANLKRRQKVNIVQTDQYGNVVDPADPFGDGGGFGGAVPAVEEAAEEADTEIETEDFTWPDDEQAFVSRQLMLGTVFVFQENPFPGTAHDWSWFLKSLPNDQQTWTKRHGISARIGSNEFLDFLIPSVRGIPVFAFLLLITLFTIVIGPLNYLWLWRKRRLYLLVLTIPAFALATSLALFSYSAFAHGFSTKSRARTMTFIDQKSNTAVSIGRIALFAGLAPRGGMRFSTETAVYPIWPENTGFESGAVDWTDQQNLASGWLPSRTRTQFLTVSHRDERGRLTVNDTGGDTLEVTNGLEWGLKALIVADKQGRLFYGEDIPAGASSQLPLLTDENHREFQQLASVFPLAKPKQSYNSNGMFDWDFNRYYGYGQSNQASFSTNIAERRLRTFRQLKKETKEIEPSTYAAIVSENPGIELGVEKTRPQASLHMLQGWY